MCSSWSVANETLGGQVHFPWLPFLPGLRCRLHWAHLVPRVKTGTSIRKHSFVFQNYHLCPSFPLLLLQYNNSIFRISFTCDVYIWYNEQIQVSKIGETVQLTLLKLIQSNCLSYQSPKYNPQYQFEQPIKFLRMWHSSPVLWSYTPGAHIPNTCVPILYSHVQILYSSHPPVWLLSMLYCCALCTPPSSPNDQKRCQHTNRFLSNPAWRQ